MFELLRNAFAVVGVFSTVVVIAAVVVGALLTRNADSLNRHSQYR